MESIRVSEHFYSIQGEGPSVGVPAVFLRLQGCNLDCGQVSGTWSCDTATVWKKGTKNDIGTFFKEFWKTYEIPFQNKAHLIITGGEPLLQQDSLVEFLNLFEVMPTVEVETNGTLKPTRSLANLISQWNVSPKLSNSGEPYSKRIKKEALDWFKGQSNAIFKFVVSGSTDIIEIETNFRWLKNHPIRQKYLMPAADTKVELENHYEAIIEIAKTNGYSLSQRFHISMWDQTTGV